MNRTLAAVPRHLALETLYRAEAQVSPQYPERTRNDHGAEYTGEFLYGGDEYSYKNLDQQNEETTTDGNSRTTTPYQGYGNYDTRPGHEPQEEMDDFYARTSEIITFAEPGTYIIYPFLISNNFYLSMLIHSNVKYTISNYSRITT